MTTETTWGWKSPKKWNIVSDSEYLWAVFGEPDTIHDPPRYVIRRVPALSYVWASRMFKTHALACEWVGEQIDEWAEANRAELPR